MKQHTMCYEPLRHEVLVMPKDAALEALFANKDPAVRAAYDKVLSSLAKVGPVAIEPKKTSIHLVRETGFAGAHPKKVWLDLTIRSENPIKSARVRAQEQVSKNRWHQDVRLTSPKDVDAEVVAWLKSAYELAGA
ncbi:MAG: DUF5655 domain-containing protein [Terricaulis sp.]